MATNTSYTWSKARVFKNKWVLNKYADKSRNTTNKEQSEKIIDKLCPPWAPTDPSALPTTNEENAEFFDQPFSLMEFNMALDSRGDRSAPGIDGVNYEVLHHLPTNYRQLLLDIFNEMYRDDEYPDSWKQSFIHLAAKSDGDSRPLALTFSAPSSWSSWYLIDYGGLLKVTIYSRKVRQAFGRGCPLLTI